MVWYDKIFQICIKFLFFYPKDKLENILNTELWSIEYYIICIGFWIILFSFLKFIFCLLFKVLKLLKYRK